MSAKKWIKWSFVTLFFMFGMSCSKRVTAPEENLEWTVYTVAEGLNYKLIYDIAIDNQDKIWIATWWGINVFDGQKWDTIDASDGLPYENARVLHFDHQGNLWIGYGGNGNGLVKFDGTNFTTFSTADGLSDSRIECIASQDDGTIWVGTVFGGVCRYKGGSWTCFDTQYVNHRHVQSIYVQNDSSIWFGTSDGATHYDGKIWTKNLRIFDTEPYPNGLPYFKQIKTIGFDSKNTGWFGFAYGVYRYSNNEFSIMILDNYESVGVSDVAPDLQGRVWFSSYSKGVFCYNNGTWNHYDVKDGLPDYYVTSVEVDSKGNIWFGTGSGLVKLTILSD